MVEGSRHSLCVPRVPACQTETSVLFDVVRVLLEAFLILPHPRSSVEIKKSG